MASVVEFETPLTFPLIGEGNRRVYVVNDRDGLLRAVDSSSSSSSAAGGSTGAAAAGYNKNYDEEEYAAADGIGMASVSEIVVETNSNSAHWSSSSSSSIVVVATSPVADRVLAVTLMKPNAEPLVIHLDFAAECTIFTKSVVAVKAFGCGCGTQSSANGADYGDVSSVSAIQLVLVDAAAVVVTLRFTVDTLTPIAVPCCSSGGKNRGQQQQQHQRPTVVDVRCFVPGAAVQPTTAAANTATICSSMVAFISRDVLLISLNPYLLAVDLLQERVQPWSKSTCLEDMRSRASGLRSLLTKGAELLLFGKWEAVIIDMNPVAAVCTADNDPSTVFTLHSDGTVRHWTMMATPTTAARGTVSSAAASSLAPYTVRDLHVNHIPDPSTWSSDAVNSTYMTARMYEHLSRVFVLCVHVQTTVISATTAAAAGEADHSSSSRGFFNERDSETTTLRASKHVLVAIDGPAANLHHHSNNDDDDATAAENTHSIRLAAPAHATALVDMQLDPQSDRCQMRALFHCRDNTWTNDDDDNDNDEDKSFVSSSAAVVCTYTPSSLSILSREPVVTNPDYLLDGVAKQERERIASLSFVSQVLCGGNTNSSIEDVLFEVDRRFLQFLFRPSFPRGNGTVLPPSAKHIRRAMQRLLPSHRMLSSGSIELVVVRFVQEWRKREHYRVLSMTPVQKKKQQEAAARTPGCAMQAHYAGASLYDALENDDNEEQDDDDGVNYFEMDHDEDMDDDTIRDTQKELVEHERRWRQLLVAICEEEQIERVPVAMSIAANSTADAAVIVRPGCICALTANNYNSKGAGQASLLDKVSMKLLDVLTRGTSGLLEAEQFIWESVSQGELTLNPDIVLVFKEKLGCIDLPPLEEEYRKLARELTHVRDEQWISLLYGSPLHSSLPGLCLLSDGGPIGPDLVSPHNPVMGVHSRLAAGSLMVRGADSARRLSLARYLVLSELGSAGAAETALRMYVHAIAVMGVASRTVPFPPVASLDFTLRQLQLDQASVDGSSPPKKRSRVSSILEAHGTKDKTVALDSLLIQVSQRLPPHHANTGSLSAVPIQLGGAAIKLSFQFGAASGSQASSLEQLPELGMLQMGCGEVAQPELGIRLLSVHVALPCLDESVEIAMQRKELIAKCLVLLSRSKSPKDAAKMVTRAFALLPFNAQQIEKSMGHLTTLESRIGENHVVGGNMLVEYINQAIVKVQAAGYPETDANNETLWSALFNTTISIRNWTKAYRACLMHPNADSRVEKYKRLVRAMVDSGALSDLLEKCSTIAKNSDAIQNAMYFYEIAADALSEMAMRDVYTSSAVDPEPPSDYQGALYALHVAQGQWKKAANVMDLRYVRARNALATQVPELSLEQQVRRERLIVDDIVLAAVGCFYAMKMVPDPNAKYLISCECSSHPSLPIHRRGEIVGTKHDREGDARSQGRDPSGCYMNIGDLEARAVRCKALRTLFNDGVGDHTFAMSALANEGGSSKISDRTIVDRLFARGLYPDGLSLAAVKDKIRRSKPNGRGLFLDSVSHLICGYLLPVSLDKSCAPERPTLLQLQAGIDSIEHRHQVPTLLAGSRSKKVSDLERSEIRMGAMHYVCKLTVKHTKSEQPVAMEVAQALLSAHRAATPLPPWLEELFLVGTNEADLPGLFARRRTPGTDGYLGDPASLLELYIMSGLYKDACRVVTTVLARDNYRELVAPSRLPEKGEMDYVPYQKIDLLWNLIDIRLKKNALKRDECVKLDEARLEMKSSLEQHFELMKISEMGQKSARALK